MNLGCKQLKLFTAYITADFVKKKKKRKGTQAILNLQITKRNAAKQQQILNQPTWSCPVKIMRGNGSVVCIFWVAALQISTKNSLLL